MTFDYWFDHETSLPGHKRPLAKLAWDAAVSNIQALPQRAMFDEGIAVGKVMAAKECAAKAENCPPEITMYGECKRCLVPRAIAGAIRKTFGIEI